MVGSTATHQSLQTFFGKKFKHGQGKQLIDGWQILLPAINNYFLKRKRICQPSIITFFFKEKKIVFHRLHPRDRIVFFRAEKKN